MRNYTERRKAEIALRQQHWFDMNPIELPEQDEDYVPELRIPVRLGEKEVHFVRESNLHKYFPFPFRKQLTLEEYLELYKADPQNFLY